MDDFLDVVSMLPAARLIRASRIFVAEHKANRRWDIRESFLLFFDCHRSRARNIKEAAACEFLGAKKGRSIQFYLFP